MTRKSKQPGGSAPLTYHERTHYSKSSGYGTTTKILGADSQTRFGDCCLSHFPAVDPVATPSGHIYSREAIVSYLLTKTQELKEERAVYDAKVRELQQFQQQADMKQDRDRMESFRKQGQDVAQLSIEAHADALKRSMDTKIAGGILITEETREDSKRALKRSSFWLCDSQPNVGADYEIPLKEPLKRPLSPMSGRELRLKDLIPLKLQREQDQPTEGGSYKGLPRIDSLHGSTHCGGEGRVVCSLSGKVISNQPVVVLSKSGLVILKEVFNDLVRPTMTCPLTGKQIKDGDVLDLHRGLNEFASVGQITAKRYRPTMT